MPPLTMPPDRRTTRSRLVVGLLGLMFVLGAGESVRAPSIASEPLPSAAVQQVALQPGHLSVTGENGTYKGQVLVQAPAETVWKVLTDYGNFKDFMPDIAESKMISSQGNQKVYEQVNVFRVLAFSKQARVRLAATETYPNQVAFKVVQGDVDSLQGTWTLTSPAPGQVLISHEVTVIPKASDNKNLFYGIYKNSLKKTLLAVRKETERRSQ
ncbi:MAG: SRPBCC family protein [Thermosynechococcaceae cyanobacterium]